MKIQEKAIYLIGFMGAGKSTVARCLCKMYGLQLVEMDETIASEEGMSIPDIFATKGEAYFRSRETTLLERAAQAGTVISCGGGVAMRQENVRLMQEKGIVVLLKATPETVFERVKYSTDRPLLNGNMTLEHVSELLEVRRPYYEATAEVTILTDGKTPEEICKEIEIACYNLDGQDKS